MTFGRILLTGATGYLGHHLGAELRRRGLAWVTAGRNGAALPMDLDDLDSVRRAAAAGGAGTVVHCAAMSSIAACASDPARASRANAEAVRALGDSGLRVVQVSTDLVFDGRTAPYAADAEPQPLSEYGRSKLGGERAALDCGGLVVRLPLLFGKSFDGRRGATDMLRAALRERRALVLYANEFRTPVHAADAARGIVDLVVDPDRTGVVHLGGPERVSRWQLCERFLAAVGADAGELFTSAECRDDARPRDLSLAGDWRPGRSLDAALAAS